MTPATNPNQPILEATPQDSAQAILAKLHNQQPYNLKENCSICIQDINYNTPDVLLLLTVEGRLYHQPCLLEWINTCRKTDKIPTLPETQLTIKETQTIATPWSRCVNLTVCKRTLHGTAILTLFAITIMATNTNNSFSNYLAAASFLANSIYIVTLLIHLYNKHHNRPYHHDRLAPSHNTRPPLSANQLPEAYKGYIFPFNHKEHHFPEITDLENGCPGEQAGPSP